MDYSIEDIDLELDHLLDKIPLKGHYKNLEPINERLSLDNPNVILRPDDLFQVTNRESRYNDTEEEEEEPEPIDYIEHKSPESLTTGTFNRKLNKLIQSLEQENGDFEMEEGRTRVFKGRFKPLEDNDFDLQINQYLNSDKENMDPIKVRRPNKEFKVQKPLAPSLKPFSFNHRVRQRGACKPNHRSLISLKPSIVHNNSDKPQIYLVDSSTGSLNDATQFGTELNASNCEGFPLPEDINEVVQIPTNEENQKLKMAIIKTFNNKVFLSDNNHSSSHRSGFYNKSEWSNYLKTVDTQESGVEVVNQNPTMFKTVKRPRKKSVKWPDQDQLEW